ncbi:rab gtpase [Stylonychia lemnae]|uniref:Rab gtpase n=1 Tax=Stylonychia lemnae TaxID=5949 RepID=A0A078BCN5_STYLE|nr:rab gtpase [Stylonychia lemnae]|eukprot:CDW91363.1 rab gtpase [Stylonychia lemnae]
MIGIQQEAKDRLRKQLITKLEINLDPNFDESNLKQMGLDFSSKLIENEEYQHQIKFRLWDTLGQQRFRKITDDFIKGALSVLFVFDSRSRESFNQIKNWAEDMPTLRSDGRRVALVRYH